MTSRRSVEGRAARKSRSRNLALCVALAMQEGIELTLADDIMVPDKDKVR